MKEIWFWLSKELAELCIIAIVTLVAVVWYGSAYLINKIKRRKRKRTTKE